MGMVCKHARERRCIAEWVICFIFCMGVMGMGCVLARMAHDSREMLAAEVLVMDLKSDVVFDPYVGDGTFGGGQHGSQDVFIDGWEDGGMAESVSGDDMCASGVSEPKPSTGVSASKPSTGVVLSPLDRVIEWQGVWAANPSIACWLYIPGTTIDYPVLQESVVGEYFYLDHDYLGKSSRSGSLFMPAQPYADVQDAHTIIFGHHMADKRLFFSNLSAYYKDLKAAAKNPVLYLYYPDRVEQWHVWAVVNGDQSDPVYMLPYQEGSAEYEALITDIGLRASWTNGDAPSVDQRMVVLSTCRGRQSGQPERFYACFLKDGEWPAASVVSVPVTE